MSPLDSYTVGGTSYCDMFNLSNSLQPLQEIPASRPYTSAAAASSARGIGKPIVDGYNAGFEGRVMATRTTYKYHFKVGRKVVHSGITNDLERRETEHRRRWPNGRIEQVGGRATREEAWNWERKQAGRRSSSAS